MEVSNILTLWKREMKSYMYTPMAYFFVGLFALLMGFTFWFFLLIYMDYSMKTQFGMTQQTITLDVMAESFYAYMHTILMFVLPFMTMRSITEESRQNTLVLLLTSPLSTWDIILGKFKASATLLFIMLAMTFIFPVFLKLYSPGPNGGPDMGVVLSTYTGLFLVGMTYIAIGIFWSSVTESQMVAVMLTFVTNIVFWLFGALSKNVEGVAQDILGHIAIQDQFMNFLKGELHFKSIIFFVSFIFMGLYLARESLESRSWRS